MDKEKILLRKKKLKERMEAIQRQMVQLEIKGNPFFQNRYDQQKLIFYIKRSEHKYTHIAYILEKKLKNVSKYNLENLENTGHNIFDEISDVELLKKSRFNVLPSKKRSLGPSEAKLFKKVKAIKKDEKKIDPFFGL
jgi:hypothetical protein